VLEIYLLFIEDGSVFWHSFEGTKK